MRRAITLAFEGATPDVGPMVGEVARRLAAMPGHICSVETIGSIVEAVLMASGFPDAARRYILYRDQRTRERGRRLPATVMRDALSRWVHRTKYALPGEDYTGTVERLLDMHLSRLQHVPELEPELRSAFTLVHSRSVLPSMRSMQFGGPAILAVNERMYNCCYTYMDRMGAFQDVLYHLLCGCGVGVSVQWQHILKLPPVLRIQRSRVAHHHVADTIAGWAGALSEMIRCYYISGEYPEYDYSLIRGEGSPLRTSCGRAPGHLPLKMMLESVRQILDSAAGRQLRPIEVHDIVCYLGQAVHSGGIRRSAIITLFSVDDTEMMYAKADGVYGGGRAAQRSCSNNSVIIDRAMPTAAISTTLARVLELAACYGEPGYLLVDDLSYGCNPCGEIILRPISRDGRSGVAYCNLAEINMSTVTSLEDAIGRARAASLIATIQATYTSMHDAVSTTIAREQSLIGVSLTGVMDNPEYGLSGEVLSKMRAAVIEENRRVASILGIPASARCTCIKPSGTASLLLGSCSNGIHPQYARRYIRRVIADSRDGLVKANPHMYIDGRLCFPIEAPSTAITRRDITTEEMIKHIKNMYKYWIGHSGHSISCTLEVDPSQRMDVVRQLVNIPTLAFAPPDLGQRYANMPFEQVGSLGGEALWNILVEHYRPESASVIEREIGSSCEGNRCVNVIGG